MLRVLIKNMHEQITHNQCNFLNYNNMKHPQEYQNQRRMTSTSTSSNQSSNKLIRIDHMIQQTTAVANVVMVDLSNIACNQS